VSPGALLTPSLVESLRDSSAIVYVKGVDGRYLHVNRRYLEFFGLREADICGRVDSDLAPSATIDGPRVAAGVIAENEPLQLEYTVAPVDGRPALAVWRFPVSPPGGEPVAVCAVAAPAAEVTLARKECERLMALMAAAAGGEVNGDTPSTNGEVGLEDEGRIEALHQASALAARRAHELLNELVAERELRGGLEHRLAELHDLDTVLTTERARADEAQAAKEEAEAALADADAALATERARAEQAEAAVAAEQARVDGLESTLSATRMDLEAAQAELFSERELRSQFEGRVGDAHGRTVELERAVAAKAEQAEAALAAERARAEEAEAALTAERSRANHAEAAVPELALAREQVTAAQRRATELELELDAARSELAEAQAALSGEQQQVAHLDARLTATEAELEGAHQELAAKAVPEPAVAERPTWNAEAQRALASALAGAPDWREGIKLAIGVLGSAGGWDAICAWQEDERGQCASCFATWTVDPDRMSEFETAIWQRRQPLPNSHVGDVMTSKRTRWVPTKTDDHRSQVFARHGLEGALIVPVREGAHAVAALELLTANPRPPSAELIAAIEAVAVQLGHFWQLLSVRAKPTWRFGRL
jgi:hypothetical protein